MHDELRKTENKVLAFTEEDKNRIQSFVDSQKQTPHFYSKYKRFPILSEVQNIQELEPDTYLREGESDEYVHVCMNTEDFLQWIKYKRKQI